MKTFDLILRDGIVVRHDGKHTSDVGIADGKIAVIGSNLSGSAREEINATGQHLFPGVIDAHVHFNEPGRTEWEGIETGSRALAAGGGTLFFDMPLNAHPPTLDAQSFDLKLAAAKKSSLVDFAFWGGIVPENLDKLEELAARGVVGFKAFMSDSGIDDFRRVDDETLREGMKRTAKVGKLVAVHAESESLTKKLAAEKIAAGKTSVRDYLDSRPIEAELDAIRRAIALAGETGCALHIVHVSSAAGVALVIEARQAGVNVSCETCPHYLVLTDADVERLGAVAKCAPPLRSNAERERLWQRVLAGDVTTIGSDHSPSPPEMKRDENFFKVWGGISGVQHLLPLLISTAGEFPLFATKRGEGGGEGVRHRASSPRPSPPFHGREGERIAHSETLSLIARLTSFNVADRFGLPKTKGRIEAGADADIALVDLREQFSVHAEDLHYRHKQSPYVNRTLRGKVVRTICRGKTVCLDGKIVAKPMGTLVVSAHG